MTPSGLRRVVLVVSFAIALHAPAAVACTGDCDGDGSVAVNELVSAVAIALGSLAPESCPAADSDLNGTVEINELVTAVGNGLNGCTIQPTPTPTATQSCESAGVICTVAGTGLSQFDGDGRDALDTSLYLPYDVEIDAAGRPLVLDWNNLRIRRVDEQGRVQTIMGQDLEGFPVDGALAIDTPLHHATGMERDSQGNLYVAGYHASVVFRVGPDHRVFVVAGTNEYGYGGDGGPAREAKLQSPYDVQPAGDGGFYVTDVDAHVIRAVDAAGIIRTIAGNGTAGHAGDGGPAGEAVLNEPTRMELDRHGNLYFCDTSNHLIRRIDPGGIITTFAGTGEAAYSGDGGLALRAAFNEPRALYLASNGDLYVADSRNNAIRRIDGAGTVTTVAGTGQPGFAGDGGPARDALLFRPYGITGAPDGSLWIADTFSHRVRRVAGLLDPRDE